MSSRRIVPPRPPAASSPRWPTILSACHVGCLFTRPTNSRHLPTMPPLLAAAHVFHAPLCLCSLPMHPNVHLAYAITMLPDSGTMCVEDFDILIPPDLPVPINEERTFRITNTVKVATNRTGDQLAREHHIVNEQVSSLSFAQRQELLGDDNVQMGEPGDFYGGPNSDEEDALLHPPPGEEGMYQSHAGQDTTFNDIMAGVQPGFRGDLRVRDDRVQKVVDSWTRQLPALIDAYLDLKAHGALETTAETQNAWPVHALGFEEDSWRYFTFAHPSDTANVTLVRHGYIGSSPDQPSLVFPLRLFEIFRQLHRVCLRFSIHALGKTLSNLHQGPRRESLHNQLTIAYDAYLQVLRGVDARTQHALGRARTWYMKNVCPPCLYKIVNEPLLKFSWLAAMDGNNSLKLVWDAFRAGKPHADDHISSHPRWVTPEDVDIFKDEVADSQKREKMFTLFAVSGIFLTVCRHGHVVVMCDMIRSGELMKYPLAMIKRLLDSYGKDIGLGYDIMCAFFKTLLCSSLGPRVVAMNLRGVVPAFHGHAHNRACQVGWHPLYVEGVGLKDFEECERTFGKSNHLVTVTRMTTPFHRQQAIDEHFNFHDLDKHTSSGNFIFQNYRQAIEKISMNRGQLDVLERCLGTTAADYEADLIMEQNYFKSLRSEPPKVAHTVEYMELLVKLHKRDEEAEAAKATFFNLDNNIINHGYKAPEIAKKRVVSKRHTVSKEYQDAMLLMSECHYKVAVTDLERLVVQRLFEMTKLGMSGVGYKMHEKLGKALKTRAEAIRKALDRYNAAAIALTPPRPRLTWQAIVNGASLAEFDWLSMILHFGIKPAEEEKVRLNVEIRRLITAMYDEHVDYYRAIAANLLTSPALAYGLQTEWRFRTCINTSVAMRLAKTARLVGFTGSLFPGDREDRDPTLRNGIPAPSWMEQVLDLHIVDSQYEEPDEADGLPAEERQHYIANGLAREEDFDEDLVVQLIETVSTNADV
ncbi:hypothetical protein DFH07DRAFT_948610 [Mycena maculata]|uniref:CxC2-like cysteine cluster KDZ transposase-associated domain-containing protein n=1 Tax=Mycena maculata TaxID=230809 RepID=A0AAD7KFF5_9AGAR|nr:hypothetical protein DFH07DRAFT_948610 [Mycena maculata]